MTGTRSSRRVGLLAVALGLVAPACFVGAFRIVDDTGEFDASWTLWLVLLALSVSAAAGAVAAGLWVLTYRTEGGAAAIIPAIAGILLGVLMLLGWIGIALVLAGGCLERELC
jgi:uncharacterized protein YqgC (DUF456 family)